MPRTPTRLMPPWRGAGNATAYIDQPGDIAPLESIRDVIPITPDKDRPQVGTRWGTRLAFPNVLPGPVQSFCTVERSAGQTGLQTGAQVPVVGQNRIAGTLTGHCFVLDPTLSMFAGFQDPRALFAGAFNVAYHPTLTRVAFATVYLKAGKLVSGINLCDTATRATVWQADAEDKDLPASVAGSTPILSNQIALTDQFVFVAAASYIYVFRADTGVYIRRYNVDGWAYEVMSVSVRADGTLVVGFQGTDRPATLPNQAINQGAGISGMYRSGVAAFNITASYTDPLVRIRFGGRLLSSAPFFEVDHGYARFAEFLSRQPHGCIPYAMATGPDGEVVCGITNQGWGWNNTYPPDGRKAYRNVVMLEPDGSLRWEADADGRRVAYRGTLTGDTWADDHAAGTSTYQNDIPQIDAEDDIPATGTPKPSANALAIDGLGDVYVAGQRNSQNYGVFKLAGDDGGIIWRFNPGAVVEQHAMAVDPTDNNLWVAVMRNNSWAGATGQAILIKLNTTDGSVMASYDTTPAPTNGSWMVACSPRGEVAFVVDYLS